jgi:hypothetical protein
MTTSFRQAYGPLLAQWVQDRCAYRQMRRMTLLFGGIVIVLLLVHGHIKNEPGTLLLVALPWVLLQMWVGAFLRSAIRQNRPEYACLAPHLRGRLIRLTAALYTLSAVTLSILSGLVFGHAGYGLAFGGLAAVLIIFSNRFMTLAWIMALVIPFGMSFVINDLLPLLKQVNEAEVTLAVLPVIVLLGGWGLYLVFPRGGDRHWHWHYQFSQRQDAIAGLPAKAAETRSPSGLMQLLRRLYVSALRQDSQRGAAADRAMMHVIGPGAHPGRAIAYSLMSTVLALLIGAFVSDSARGGILSAVGLIQLGAVLMYAMSAADDVVLHGAEQQLYFLTPAAPAAARINRLLIATMLRRGLAVWLVSLACAIGLDSALAGHPTLNGASFMVAVSMLWTLTPLLRNYALAPARRLGLTWSVVGIVVVLVCLGVLAVSRIVPEFPWYQAGAVAGLGAVIYLALGWRSLMALPPVLPAGRLAV